MNAPQPSRWHELFDMAVAIIDQANDRGIGTGNPDVIGLSIEGTSELDLDEIWRRAMLALSDRTDPLSNEQ
ncbi:hypothetical protein [Pararhodobacter sp. CCB-MM2]|uniref:hypothetical protein n=1 Tax=Pararhodobacter sp. CCB-MM2 TaxID=1786003 RepID=UPI000834D962|nr:hypothetical protein [Pararhodobacter sp. CCB-MM2]